MDGSVELNREMYNYCATVGVEIVLCKALWRKNHDGDITYGDVAKDIQDISLRERIMIEFLISVFSFYLSEFYLM
jgi:hypothetical protein